MFEMYAEFDLLMYGFAEAYYEGKNYEDCKAQAVQDLDTWGGGSVMLFDEHGNNLAYIER